MAMPAEEAQTVEEIVHAESARGERMVAFGRSALWALISALLLGGGIHVLVARGLGLALLCVSAASLAYGLWLNPARFKVFFVYLSICFDISFGAAVPIVTAAFAGPSGVASQLAGMTPALLGIAFMLSAATLRHNPRGSVLAGGLALAYCAVGLVLAARGPDTSLLAPSLRAWMSPAAWMVRSVMIAACGVVLTIASRNARKMVHRVGAVLADRAQVMHLFGRYVAPEIRDEIVRGQSVAEVREVTVLFTDLRDFTALSEQLAPEMLLALLNAHFATLVPIVHRFGGTVNKFVGDALMATFGAPLRLDGHAARATEAATEMLVALDAMNERHQVEGKPRLQMGIGVATGRVVVGNLGGTDRLEYAVLGNTVNLAARLESLNKETGTRVLLSEATAKALPATLLVRSLGLMKVKGKAGEIMVFTPQGADAPRLPSESINRSTPLL